MLYLLHLSRMVMGYLDPVSSCEFGIFTTVAGYEQSVGRDATQLELNLKQLEAP